MPVAREAVPFLLVLAAAAVGLGLLFGPWGASPAAILALFVLYFFRDPDRVPPEGDGLILSAADGRVTEVKPAPQGTRITVFLSVLDCHINRSPVTGTVLRRDYTRGRYHPAWQERAGRENERNHLVIRSATGDYGVTQVAGILARRIVCRKHPGDTVVRGERIGLIRFGSRTDLLLPPGIEPRVAVGDRVRGGLTVMAHAMPAAGRAASAVESA